MLIHGKFLDLCGLEIKNINATLLYAMKGRKREILRQSDANTCLACCFIFVLEHLRGGEFSSEERQELERKFYESSFGKCRESFLLSYLLALLEKFPRARAKVTFGDEFSQKYFEEVNGVSREQLSFATSLITPKFLKDKIGEKPLVAFVDKYFLDEGIHIPHYVVLTRNKTSENFQVADPWSGNIFEMTPLQVREAIWGAKYFLGWTPVVVEISLSEQFNKRPR